jgi:hypothetical protein
MIKKICSETKSAKYALIWWAFIITLAFLALMPTSTCTKVTGVILNTSVDPGDTIMHNITIIADEADPAMDYVAELYGFGMGPDGANWEIDPELDTSPYSAAEFLNVTPKSFHLEAGRSQKLILKGEVPSDIEAGSRYAIVGIKSKSYNNSENSNVVSRQLCNVG